ncbi:threonine--tRNA ligase [Candidatus Pacearchaeota archaeon]|nr:threonine--tRNA ligase [Candidatus Pacearchaeota archaeon]
MKILSLHCDYIKFKPLKPAIKGMELPKGEENQIEVKDPLVIMTAVEKADQDNKTILEDYIKNILDLKDKIGKIDRIVLYPYAHLSSSLSSPDFAKQLLIDAEKKLKEAKIDVFRAPFGFYKEFELKCKGHPLSELSRSIGTQTQTVEVKTNIVKKEEKVEVTEEERLRIVKRLSKNTMQTIRGKDDQKSNVELGKELDLYMVSEVVGQGLPLLTPKGATIKREIERFAIDEELKRGYEHTATPFMAKSDLYKVSGHWQHYQDGMFVLQDGEETLSLRPMTCPFQFVLYKRKQRSYKDLPKKYAEVATLFRKEQSGELRGLTRVRQFTLADAHLICRPDQLEEQFIEVIDLINYTMKCLGIKDMTYRFSKWDPKNKEKYIDNPAAWEDTQKKMKIILDKLKIKYIEAEGEAAFYGPKLDLQYKDVYGKEDTLLTVQIDFALPERFDMTYIDSDGKEKRPWIIHRSSTGCTERTMAYLLEKTQGNLPTWLSPVQVKVLSFTDRNEEAAKKVLKELNEAGIRAEADFTSTTVQDKVRNASMMKIPYIVTIGDKEEEKKTIAVKKRGEDKPKFGVKLKDFLEEITLEIKERK